MASSPLPASCPRLLQTKVVQNFVPSLPLTYRLRRTEWLGRQPTRRKAIRVRYLYLSVVETLGSPWNAKLDFWVRLVSPKRATSGDAIRSSEPGSNPIYNVNEKQPINSTFRFVECRAFRKRLRVKQNCLMIGRSGRVGWTVTCQVDRHASTQSYSRDIRASRQTPYEENDHAATCSFNARQILVQPSAARRSTSCSRRNEVLDRQLPPNWLISQPSGCQSDLKRHFNSIWPRMRMEIAGNEHHRDRTVEFLERAAKLEGITPEQYLLRVADGKLLETKKHDE